MQLHSSYIQYIIKNKKLCIYAKQVEVQIITVFLPTIASSGSFDCQSEHMRILSHVDYSSHCRMATIPGPHLINACSTVTKHCVKGVGGNLFPSFPNSQPGLRLSGAPPYLSHLIWLPLLLRQSLPHPARGSHPQLPTASATT